MRISAFGHASYCGLFKVALLSAKRHSLWRIKFATLDRMASPGKAARSPLSAGGPTLITSRDNRWLKEFRMALRGGLPTENGFVGVEGARLVEEALRSGCRVH